MPVIPDLSKNSGRPVVSEALGTRNPTYQGSLRVDFVKITKVGGGVIGLS